MKPTILYIDNFLGRHGQTPTMGMSLVQLFTMEGFKVKSVSAQRNKLLRLADMILAIIKNRKNSVVLLATYSTTAFYFSWGCSMVCRLLKVPYIPCLHGGNLPERMLRSPKKCGQLFGHSFANVAVSGYLAEQLKKYGWKHEEIPNFIDIRNYPFVPRTKASPRLLWVRSFHQIYNPHLAVRILHLLISQFPSAMLTMVGPDKDGSMITCKQLASELQIADRIQFTGLLSTEEWVDLSAKHDIFLNTTTVDNLPLSVIEAMALGMIVISTNVGGLPFLLKQNVDGILLPKNDTVSFVSAIRQVVDNSSLAASLSANARNSATAFDYSNIITKWSNLLNSVPVQ